MPLPASTMSVIGGGAASMPKKQMRRSLLAASARTASAHRLPRSRVQERGPTPPAGMEWSVSALCGQEGELRQEHGAAAAASSAVCFFCCFFQWSSPFELK